MNTPARHRRPLNVPTVESLAKEWPQSLNWRQAWLPRQTRVLTDEELAQVGKDTAAHSLAAVAMWIWVLLWFFMMFMWYSDRMKLDVLPLLTIDHVVMMYVAPRLWREQSRRRQAAWSAGGVAVAVGWTLLHGSVARGEPGSRELVIGFGGMVILAMCAVWWAIAFYRAHQIEAWLNLQSEQQQALDLARQLATAQIQPHFLFNSLASLQQWVQAKDDRAAPMLQALTGFLRATLPLFDREQLTLDEEAEAAREYLAVMQLRLGERLRYTLDLAPEAAAAQLPPGLLLTLVENAVEHGVMPSLGGAQITVQARVTGGRVHLTVQDTGPGLPAVAREGVGLANTRARLAQALGSEAGLNLSNAPAGGCIATIYFPLQRP